MKARLLRALVLALAAILLAVETTSACLAGLSYDEEIIIRCGERSATISVEEYGTTDRLAARLEDLDTACGTNLEENQQILKSEYEKWPRLWGNGGHQLTIVLWSPEQEAQLKAQNERLNLDDCQSAVKYRHVGNWLSYHPTYQPYCSDKNYWAYCVYPDYQFSPPLFLLYTFRHPLRVLAQASPQTMPYLVAALVITAALAATMFALIRKRKRLITTYRLYAKPLGITALIAGFGLPFFSIFIWWPFLLPPEITCLAFPLGIVALLLGLAVDRWAPPSSVVAGTGERRTTPESADVGFAALKQFKSND